MEQVRVKFETDTQGNEIARVPVGKDGLEAVLDRSDYEFLLKLGASPSFMLRKQGYVTVWLNGRADYVARILMRATPYQQVRFRDGNRCNLRRSNLRVRINQSFGAPGHRAHASGVGPSY